MKISVSASHKNPKFRGGFMVVCRGYIAAIFPMTDTKTEEEAQGEALTYVDDNGGSADYDIFPYKGSSD